MRSKILHAFALLAFFASAVLPAAVIAAERDKPAAAGPSGPWDMATLRKAPSATWGATNGLVQEVYYEGEPFNGKPTRVFAYYGRPEGKGPFPAVVLVHGGGGTAFADWARQWAGRGYVALAMDLSGNGPSGKLPDGGPGQGDEVKFADLDTREMWSYYAVAAVIRGHSLLSSRPEVDARRTAITGISWGGYLTCIVAGLDDRFKAAVPVYGCGFISENSCWVEPWFKKMGEAQRQRWVENFDPSRCLGRVKCPMLFVDGTCDFPYPLDSLKKSYSLVTAPVTLSVVTNRPHGHIFTFKEVDAFIDNCLNGGQALAKLGAMQTTGATVSATVSSPSPITNAELDYTTDSGPWHKRVWKGSPAKVEANTVTASLPAERPLVCYLLVTDQRGLSVSTPHVELH